MDAPEPVAVASSCSMSIEETLQIIICRCKAGRLTAPLRVDPKIPPPPNSPEFQGEIPATGDDDLEEEEEEGDDDTMDSA
jgi:hypothetical protein